MWTLYSFLLILLHVIFSVWVIFLLMIIPLASLLALSHSLFSSLMELLLYASWKFPIQLLNIDTLIFHSIKLLHTLFLVLSSFEICINHTWEVLATTLSLYISGCHLWSSLYVHSFVSNNGLLNFQDLK